jgi:superfamily I DNA/RNA helicase
MNQETAPTIAPYLAKLNADQRRAVEHGVTGRGANIAPPLLVIAGAGSGRPIHWRITLRI